ncbi:hypothetical protein JQ629_21975 [Bradyrhizobium sp. AUGA SZCCT0222]|uniref:hypothetical protein n=1 Tax=Bradyrhizobium sp. AUGA SZCCT0222 TaxID=2807668 RepID=UPI001BA8C82D|nr:hypothetical protein [Bradyrhizobium sp. AUGA SZCCT0222]MBR1270149.1 hypothetical protein [Bradyrhizobium sp. AUGA SZCCT0222]
MVKRRVGRRPESRSKDGNEFLCLVENILEGSTFKKWFQATTVNKVALTFVHRLERIFDERIEPILLDQIFFGGALGDNLSIEIDPDQARYLHSHKAAVVAYITAEKSARPRSGFLRVIRKVCRTVVPQNGFDG